MNSGVGRSDFLHSKIREIFGKTFNMKKATILFVLVFWVSVVLSQKVDWDKIKNADPDRILLSGQQKPTQVLLLGTFHFGYPNLDAHKTDSLKFVNVLSPSRQKELEELAEVIKRFRPTRVYIETRNTSFHDSLYAEYKKGNYELGRNEIYQVGYRVAKEMNLDKLYPVDAGNFLGDYYKSIPLLDSLDKVSEPVDAQRDKMWNRRYKALYNTSDSFELSLTMLENFLMMAEQKTLYRMHGHYLCAGFNTVGNDGPDRLALWWYSRNLRIFNNILKTKPTTEDRIMVLFGNGHMPILRHCFQSSPEFEVVELKNLLR